MFALTLQQLVRIAFRMIGTKSGALFIHRGAPVFAVVRVHSRMPVLSPDPVVGRTLNDLATDIALFLWHQVAIQCKIYGVVNLGHVRLIRLQVKQLSLTLVELRLILGVC